ncbi:unnamed protein product [Linum trigynum]|uniref:Dirigent protein n=1 Tax=Linum trigynum TaxID=586398 RepID=A0AAV2CZ35_9ROSI
MAATKSFFLPLVATLAALLLAAAESQTSFSTKKQLLTMKKQKLTHLHFYWSNFRSGPEATALIVAPILDNATFYGTVALNDDMLTLGPDPDDSTSVGKARGLYHFPSDTTDLVYEMIYSFAFTYGGYNGSSLSLLGSVFPTSKTASELSVAGGTGVFRFARGYAVMNFLSFDPVRSLILNELDVYVLHY